MIKVLHIINSLNEGGAETNLFQLLKFRESADISPSVVSLGAKGYFDDKIRDMGIPVVNLNFKRHPIRTIRKLRSIVKDHDVICCWMYLSNYIGYICAKKFPEKKIIWNVRHSNVKLKGENFLTYCIIRRCAKLSRNVDAILYNGSRARINHEKIKYDPRVGYVIENGCNPVFLQKSDGGERFREENGLVGAKILLSVGRFHPIKDIGTFICAFAICKGEIENLKAVVCGSGYLPTDPRLQKLCADNGLKIGQDIFFLGKRNDINVIMGTSDYYVLHSLSEAFPNTLIQAMASGCLCVSTDAGDAKRILGDESLIAAPGDHESLAKMIIRLDGMSDDEKKKMIRTNLEIIKERYTVESAVRTYEDLISTIVSKDR